MENEIAEKHYRHCGLAPKPQYCFHEHEILNNFHFEIITFFN
jgi:hypothetical protein